jgi:CRISPR-associated protein Cmr4
VVLEKALPREEILQFGGKATIGRGRCRMIPMESAGSRPGANYGAAQGAR